MSKIKNRPNGASWRTKCRACGTEQTWWLAKGEAVTGVACRYCDKHKLARLHIIE